jgi:pyruvate dehydrogenase E2 component (dihydrolipoamide acetyltransferase)
MKQEFKLPELGENIESGDIVNVLVREGQTIAANDGVLELETDKAIVELPCPHAGKIVKVLVKKGQTVKVGQPLLTIEAEAEAEVPLAGPAKPPPVASEAPRPMVAASQKRGEDLIPAGPAVRRLARELGVDLSKIKGSGPQGRITPEDVQAAAKTHLGTTAGSSSSTAVGATAGSPSSASPEQTTSALAGKPSVAPQPPVAPIPPGKPDQDAWGPIRRDRMTKVRQTIAAQMARSASTIPHVTNFDDADITDLEALRKGVPAGYLGADIKLTTMPFVLKAVAMALRNNPVLNASLDEENQQIIYKEYVNIGVAVDTPRGLVVPVLRGVDQFSIPEIARSLALLAQRARAAQFAVEDLRGGTFTISNLGAVGGSYSTPIINHPEAAVLLLGRSRWMPMAREGKIEPRYMLPLSLSFDHRLVDGAAAGRFLNEVIDLLQSPGKIVFGG